MVLVGFEHCEIVLLGPRLRLRVLGFRVYRPESKYLGLAKTIHTYVYMVFLVSPAKPHPQKGELMSLS